MTRLNDLSVASRVHLLEPQWNPSVERQAIGRVLRLGQEREVNIIRYIMRGSIEEVSDISISFAELKLTLVIVGRKEADSKASFGFRRFQSRTTSKRYEYDMMDQGVLLHFW